MVFTPHPTPTLSSEKGLSLPKELRQLHSPGQVALWKPAASPSMFSGVSSFSVFVFLCLQSEGSCLECVYDLNLCFI